ncbi:2,5-dioxovalerate dehydrogenase [Capsulimonas corticalis]|uniref:2,5-dioxovalerate dehydrogenase n=1 Tax=Capsulimonas corticalis TaxID=2219043 RepID=A0A402D6J5_9BACT|nr:aldehyde dehydrogenase (NADP(+)) [Capsulimonas corticalis]BDI32445.1 2,5-dioxovalerate dehydrogenase [Capsulimonas corticalis]
MTTLHGRNLLGETSSALGDITFSGYSTLTGQALKTVFHEATPEEIDRAVSLAAGAAGPYRALPAEARADFLSRIADEIVALGDDLLEIAHQESALPKDRLTGERGRTVGQLRMFADLVREGSYVDARIDRALPDRAPLPRPDMRRMLIPLGPVAVFGASNFPFAFSVAGGDTASALAAGCPVVVKAHPAHPGTSEMVGEAVLRAVRGANLPEGVFSMVHGRADVGGRLARHPDLEAVAFTGSLGAGRALFDIAASRPKPIPVYAEMGSVNPVFILPGALAERGEALAAGLAQSVTAGVGQFCTNPGLVVGIQGPALDAFVQTVARAVSKTPSSMLTMGICSAYHHGRERLKTLRGVHLETPPAEKADAAMALAAPSVFSTDAETFLQTHALSEEVFGPLTLVVACRNPRETLDVARRLEGQLTATVHAGASELSAFRDLVTTLETKAGRLIFNGFPTGVEVAPTMQHGGPYPATTDSRSTSVGTAAIFRFLRPICWQGAPRELLPPELQDENPRGIWRMVDNHWTREGIV